MAEIDGTSDYVGVAGTADTTGKSGKATCKKHLRLNYEPKKMDAFTVHLARKDWLNQMLSIDNIQDVLLTNLVD
jgi:hypothetical protein